MTDKTGTKGLLEETPSVGGTSSILQTLQTEKQRAVFEKMITADTGRQNGVMATVARKLKNDGRAVDENTDIKATIIETLIEMAFQVELHKGDILSGAVTAHEVVRLIKQHLQKNLRRRSITPQELETGLRSFFDKSKPGIRGKIAEKLGVNQRLELHDGQYLESLGENPHLSDALAELFVHPERAREKEWFSTLIDFDPVASYDECYFAVIEEWLRYAITSMKTFPRSFVEVTRQPVYRELNSVEDPARRRQLSTRMLAFFNTKKLDLIREHTQRQAGEHQSGSRSVAEVFAVPTQPAVSPAAEAPEPTAPPSLPRDVTVPTGDDEFRFDPVGAEPDPWSVESPEGSSSQRPHDPLFDVPIRPILRDETDAAMAEPTLDLGGSGHTSASTPEAPPPPLPPENTEGAEIDDDVPGRATRECLRKEFGIRKLSDFLQDADNTPEWVKFAFGKLLTTDMDLETEPIVELRDKVFAMLFVMGFGQTCAYIGNTESDATEKQNEVQRRMRVFLENVAEPIRSKLFEKLSEFQPIIEDEAKLREYYYFFVANFLERFFVGDAGLTWEYREDIPVLVGNDIEVKHRGGMVLQNGSFFDQDSDGIVDLTQREEIARAAHADTLDLFEGALKDCFASMHSRLAQADFLTDTEYTFTLGHLFDDGTLSIASMGDNICIVRFNTEQQFLDARTLGTAGGYKLLMKRAPQNYEQQIQIAHFDYEPGSIRLILKRKAISAADLKRIESGEMSYSEIHAVLARNDEQYFEVQTKPPETKNAKFLREEFGIQRFEDIFEEPDAQPTWVRFAFDRLCTAEFDEEPEQLVDSLFLLLVRGPVHFSNDLARSESARKSAAIMRVDMALSLAAAGVKTRLHAYQDSLVEMIETYNTPDLDERNEEWRSARYVLEDKRAAFLQGFFSGENDWALDLQHTGEPRIEISNTLSATYHNVLHHTNGSFIGEAAESGVAYFVGRDEIHEAMNATTEEEFDGALSRCSEALRERLTGAENVADDALDCIVGRLLDDSTLMIGMTGKNSIVMIFDGDGLPALRRQMSSYSSIELSTQHDVDNKNKGMWSRRIDLTDGMKVVVCQTTDGENFIDTENRSGNHCKNFTEVQELLAQKGYTHVLYEKKEPTSKVHTDEEALNTWAAATVDDSSGTAGTMDWAENVADQGHVDDRLNFAHDMQNAGDLLLEPDDDNTEVLSDEPVITELPNGFRKIDISPKRRAELVASLRGDEWLKGLGILENKIGYAKYGLSENEEIAFEIKKYIENVLCKAATQGDSVLRTWLIRMLHAYPAKGAVNGVNKMMGSHCIQRAATHGTREQRVEGLRQLKAVFKEQCSPEFYAEQIENLTGQDIWDALNADSHLADKVAAEVIEYFYPRTVLPEGSQFFDFTKEGGFLGKEVAGHTVYWSHPNNEGSGLVYNTKNGTFSIITLPGRFDEALLPTKDAVAARVGYEESTTSLKERQTIRRNLLERFCFSAVAEAPVNDINQLDPPPVPEELIGALGFKGNEAMIDTFNRNSHTVVAHLDLNLPFEPLAVVFTPQSGFSPVPEMIVTVVDKNGELKTKTEKPNPGDFIFILVESTRGKHTNDTLKKLKLGLLDKARGIKTVHDKMPKFMETLMKEQEPTCCYVIEV